MVFLKKLFAKNIFKLSVTLAIYFCFLAYGICCNLFGPTWLDLKMLLNTSMEKMALSISLRSGSFSIGALIGGFLFNYLNRQVLYSIFLFIMGVSTILIPLIPNFNIFLLLNSIFGIVSGASDTAVNVWMLDMWQEKSGPFMQALQFCWAVGFILAPLISHPFLAEEHLNSDNVIDSHGYIFEDKQDIINNTDIFEVSNHTTNYTTTTINITQSLDLKPNKLYIPFTISGSLVAFGSLIIIILYFYKRYLKNQKKIINLTLLTECNDKELEKPNLNEIILINDNMKHNQRTNIELNEEQIVNDTAIDDLIDENENIDQEVSIIYEDKNDIDLSTGSGVENENDTQSNSSSKSTRSSSSSCVYTPLMVTFSCLMVCFFCASEMTTFQYLTTFVVKLPLGLNKFIGSFILSALAITFTIGRFVGIIIAIKLNPEYILLLDWIIMLLGNLVLLFSPFSRYFLWSGSMILGFGFAAFFPAVFSFLRNRLRVTNIISALLLLSSLAGNALGFPVFVGKFIENTPLVLIYGNFFCLLIIVITFIAIYLIEKKYTKNFEHLN